MCFFSPIRNDPKKTHKQIFGTPPVPGQSRKFVYVYVFFLFLSKILVRNSGAGNGCANLMGAYNFCVLSAGKPPCP